MDKSKVITWLRRSDFFGLLSMKHLESLYDKFIPISFESGQTLMSEGDQPDFMYLIIHGRLKVFRRFGQDVKVYAEIGQGEIVGEFALLTEEKRHASVISIRDSYLLKLGIKDFQQFISENPAEAQLLWKCTLLRALNSGITGARRRDSPIASIALIPRTNSPNIKATISSICSEISYLNAMAHLNESKIPRSIDRNLPPEEYSNRITAWLDDLEFNYPYIVYEAENLSSLWTERCIRQADTIVFFAEENEDPSLNKIEKLLFNHSISKSIHLVIEQESNIEFPNDSSAWRNLRPNVRVHYLRRQNQQDLRRICRLVTGQPRALILSGGGCLGYAHLGVYKALEELDISIDCIAGVSAGACVGALLASDKPFDEIIEITKEKLIKKSNKIKDYVLPFASLFRGLGWENILKSIFSDHHIENLWIDFFTLACDINSKTIDILDRGLIWKAVRASTSLPGIFPPFVYEDGKTLIDGGVLNNFPIEQMCDRIGSGVVIGSGFKQEQDIHIPSDYSSLSDWSLTKEYMIRKKNKYSSLPEIIQRSVTIASDQDAKSMRAKADLYIEIDRAGVTIFDFKTLDKMIDLGYSVTMKKARDLLKLTRSRF